MYALTSLAGMLGRPRTGSFTSASVYRKYAAGITSQATIAGVNDVSVKRITYEVGPRYGSVAAAMAQADPNSLAPDVTYETSEVLSATFTGLARRHSNFAGTFKAANLMGVVERIAKGLAVDSAHPDGCTAQGLLGGASLRIHALQTYFSPVGASQDTVFIPRVVDDVLAPDVFSVLCHAVCGEGGVVATDLVEVNASSREPVIRDVDGYAFAPAAVDALRVLGANFVAAGQGDLFALGVTRGIHGVVSVVGHSDEGGVLRDILRTGSVAVPFGGIHSGLTEYIGLPALATADGATVAGYVDSLALATAAVVAHCDPGAVVGGAWYPTITQGTPTGPELKPGSHTADSDDHIANNHGQLMGSFDAFAVTYTRALGQLFEAPGSTDLARKFLCASAAALPASCRHLRGASAAPYFWIEPTSLIPHDYLGSVAEREGFGAICSRARGRTLPAWEAIEPAERGDGFSTAYYVRFRGARAAPFLHHFLGHARDGLANVIPRQLDVAGVIHPGSDDIQDVGDRLQGSAHLGRYLWTRGQSPVVAPGEFLNLGETMAIQVMHLTYDGSGFIEPHHVPSATEFAALTINFTVTAPVGIDPGPLTEWPVGARRARTRASRALASAARKVAMFGSATVADIPILASAPPVLRSRPAGISIGPLADSQPGGGGALVAVEAAHEPNDGVTVGGVPLATVMANGPASGPPLGGVPRNTGPAGLAPSDPAGTRPPPPPPAVEPHFAHGAPPLPIAATAGAPGERADAL